MTHHARHRARVIGRLKTAAAVLATVVPLAIALPATPGEALDVGPNVVTGVVTMPSGTSAAGAEVELLAVDLDLGDLSIGKTATDATGSFSVAIPATPELIARAQVSPNTPCRCALCCRRSGLSPARPTTTATSRH